ncbi:MAG: septum formation initiator family protein [Candidatus Levybacteria bacterium]|nr:septum formation initiator family protein [Candidatus Levybacteria bacterium]
MKKILFFVGIAVGIVIINGLVRSIYDLWKKQDLVVSAKRELEKEKKENEKLKRQLVLVGTEEFIESEARNKLFMVKPGEEGVIVPQDLIKKKEKKEVAKLPNWQQWVNLFGF